MSKKTGKRLLMLALAMVLCVTTVVCPSMATTSKKTNTIDIRVNGYLVEFPDTQPYVDKNNRTMVPIRFVSEALGATVDWDNPTKTATVSKDGISVDVTIGKKTITITDADGKVTTKEMDTEAVTTGERTMVPVRFVAEALGAWVSWSSAFNTVLIYNDGLTADEINELQSLAYTQSFCSGKQKYENSNTTFEDLNELAYEPGTLTGNVTRNSVYTGLTWNSKTGTMEELANLHVQHIQKSFATRFTMEMWGVTATFRTSGACIFSSPSAEGATPYVIYGYLTLTFADDANIDAYKKFYCMTQDSNCNFQQGGTYTLIVESTWTMSSIYRTPWHTDPIDRTNGVDVQWK
jgi:hypothetical protein